MTNAVVCVKRPLIRPMRRQTYNYMRKRPMKLKNRLEELYYQCKYAYFYKGMSGLKNEIKDCLRMVFTRRTKGK
jgi:hypothetical protein